MNSISDYAAEAVRSLSGMGIINGNNGLFMPKNKTTRAEAVAMIMRMAKIIEEEAHD